MKKEEVEQMQNIDSLKSYAILNLDIVRQNTKTNSDNATKRLWLIFIIGIIQLFLWISRTPRKE
jgi:hypothetical protein